VTKTEDAADEKVTVKGYTTKFIVTFSEKINDGGTTVLTMHIGKADGTQVSMYRLQQSKWDQELRGYGTYQSGTGLADANAMEKVKYRMAVGLIKVAEMRAAKLSGELSLFIKGHHVEHDAWQFDSDPTDRAWKNIDGTMERYSSGVDSNHKMTFDPNAAGARQ